MSSLSESPNGLSFPTHRDAARLGVDGLAWFVGMLFAAFARFDFQFSAVDVLSVSHRDAARLGVDGLAWFVGMLFAAFARFDFQFSDVDVLSVLGFAVAAVLLQWVIGTALFLYRGRYRYGSFDEVSGVATTVLIVGVVLSVLDLVLFNDRSVPASTPSWVRWWRWCSCWASGTCGAYGSSGQPGRTARSQRRR